MDAADVASAFRRRHDRDPEVIVSAPGRVNLIGEHTDYSLLPVLPMAIDRRLLIALGTSGTAEVHSSHGNEATRRYVDAAITAVRSMGGALIEIGSDLPVTGGLSSSSALTLGLVRGLATLSGTDLTLEETIEAAIRAERQVGVESGGMDQTVIARALAGHALRIDFRPYSHRLVPIPPGLAVVAAYSGTAAPKAGRARQAYNDRVIGCRLAAVMLGADADSHPVLADVAGASQAEIERLPESTTLRRSGLSNRIARLARSTFDHNREVPVRESARHVLTEAKRVGQFEAALVKEDLGAAGRLLNESHESLIRFGASTPDLDRLVGAMRSAGAMGARLTGAGFGGFAIAVCASGAVAEVTEAALAAAGGPVFEVAASDGVRVERV